jgi:hypothetical protein
MQARKEAFLLKAGDRQTDDYLSSTRVVPLSRYEIKAGWEIPAILEQSLNSDLPGELRALVTSSVYDTASGLYLLIPQGSRLIGKYIRGSPTVKTGPGHLEPRHLSRRFIDRPRWNARSQFSRKRGVARQSRPPLSPAHRFLCADQYVHRSFQYFAEAEQNRPCVSNGRSNCSGCGWSGVKPDGRPDYAPEPERAADDQSPGGLPVQRSREPRHSFRITLRVCGASKRSRVNEGKKMRLACSSER